MNVHDRDICDRLRLLRVQKYGPRGKAQFAKSLGIRASTYQQYESTRIPPVDLLVRAAELTGCDLLWLLVGDDAGKPGVERGPQEEHPVLARIRKLLQRRPETAQSLSAFITLIDPVGPPSPDTDPSELPAAMAAPALSGATNQLVPVVGSTAAGTARFWRELLAQRQHGGKWDAEANDRLERLLEECAERGRSTDARVLRDAWDPKPDATAALIQLSRPDELGLLEFLSCPGLDAGRRFVAWRVDGDSMTPRYRDGDFVLVSPDEPALDGSPCVAHQRGQIGVNCKVFKQDGADIVLIPLNETFALQRFPAADLVWAHRVLFSVRLKANQFG